MKKARGYEMDSEVTIKRSKHRVYLNDQTTIDDLLRELENVPSGATFDEFEWYSEDEHYIEFHHQTRID